MKWLVLGFLIGISFLPACGQFTPVPVIDSPTVTPSLLPTSTPTSIPTATSIASITPLPTIPTFTPTFDISTIVTVTPALEEQCPQSNPEAKLDTSPFQGYPEKSSEDQIYRVILDYLNAGGSKQVANSEILKNHKYGYPYGSTIEIDLTNDSVLEFIIKIGQGFTMYTCKNGAYQAIMSWLGHIYPAIILDTIDLNRNNVPELIIGEQVCTGNCLDTYVFEWDGREFKNIIEWQTMTVSDVEIHDTNDDGLYEIIASGPFPGMSSFVYYTPLRGQKDIYAWNGKTFSLYSQEFSTPDYRFQTIQDADIAVSVRKYESAFQLYQEAISNPELEWWSPERYKYGQAIIDSLWLHEPTPSVEPPENKTEFPRLAAYAHYRIMLLHLVQGQELEAIITYNTLQEKFGNDPYGSPYVEMATAFWEAYQSTHKMYDGCAAAIQYAVEHPEILIPLGSDYHGWQSHTYVPADVCPFR